MKEVKVTAHIELLTSAGKWVKASSDEEIPKLCRVWRLNWSQVMDGLAINGIYEFKSQRDKYRIVKTKEKRK